MPASLGPFLLWSALINYAVLLLAFIAWAGWGDALYRSHARWFRLERAQCDGAIYLMLGLYKLAIWSLFLVPWIALRIVGG